MFPSPDTRSKPHSLFDIIVGGVLAFLAAPFLLIGTWLMLVPISFMLALLGSFIWDYCMAYFNHPALAVSWQVSFLIVLGYVIFSRVLLAPFKETVT